MALPMNPLPNTSDATTATIAASAPTFHHILSFLARSTARSSRSSSRRFSVSSMRLSSLSHSYIRISPIICEDRLDRVAAQFDR